MTRLKRGVLVPSIIYILLLSTYMLLNYRQTSKNKKGCNNSNYDSTIIIENSKSDHTIGFRWGWIYTYNILYAIRRLFGVYFRWDFYSGNMSIDLVSISPVDFSWGITRAIYIAMHLSAIPYSFLYYTLVLSYLPNISVVYYPISLLLYTIRKLCFPATKWDC